MSKQKAAEKVAKLLELARGTTNPHEAAAARAEAERLVAQHGLTDADLENGEMGAAFDDLVDQVGRVASTGNFSSGLFDARSIVDKVLQSIKEISKADKATRLRQFTTLVRTASFVAGDNKVIAEVKTTLDTVLKNHHLVI